MAAGEKKEIPLSLPRWEAAEKGLVKSIFYAVHSPSITAVLIYYQVIQRRKEHHQGLRGQFLAVVSCYI